MHLRPAERLIVGLLAGGHLHQGWAGQENFRAFLDHHHVVTHTGDVGAAGGGVAEHQRDSGNTGRRQPGQIAEHPPARDEDLLLGGQIRSAGLHQGNDRQSVLQGNLVGAQDFLHRPRVGGSALDGGIVGDQHALHALDHSDPGHHAGPDVKVGAIGGQCAELEERGVRIDQQFDTFASGHLAASVMALNVFRSAARQRLGKFSVEFDQFGRHRRGGVDVCRC